MIFSKHHHLQGSPTREESPWHPQGQALPTLLLQGSQSPQVTEQYFRRVHNQEGGKQPTQQTKVCPHLPYPQRHQARQSRTLPFKCACTEERSAVPCTGFPSKSEFLFPAEESLWCFLLHRPMCVTQRTGRNPLLQDQPPSLFLEGLTPVPPKFLNWVKPREPFLSSPSACGKQHRQER